MKKLILSCLLVLGVSFASPAAPFTIDWYQIAGGGGTSTNSQFSLSGTIGQFDASPAMSYGTLSLYGGFWGLYYIPPLPPGITNFSPGFGDAGTNVVITGTNLSGTTSVTFNGMPAVFAVNSANQITATVPACAGSGPIVVFTPWGSSQSAQIFDFLKQPATVSTATETSLDNALCNGNPVTFATDGTITITGTKTISSDVTVDGTGHNVTISGSGSTGVFIVNPGVHLTLINMTVANGTSEFAGGGLYNNGGIVTLINCTFTNNLVASVAANAYGGNSHGGAVENDNGTLVISNCTFAANGARGNGNVGGSAYGGALCNDNGGTITVYGSTFAGNQAVGGSGTNGTFGSGQFSPNATAGGAGGSAYGGAVSADGGSMTFTNCTFYNNSCFGANGGYGGSGWNGYSYNYSCNCDPFCQTCVGYVDGGYGVSGGNGGNAYGGSIYNGGATVTMVSSTVASGYVTSGFGGSGGENGAYSGATSSPGNGGNGTAYGGNVFNQSQFLFLDTIVAYGNDYPFLDVNFGSSGVTDLGYNLNSDGAAVFYATSSTNNVDPLLGPLTNNGGFTMTMALPTNSPAVRAGTPVGAPATDQRGITRKYLSIDMGAYETPAPGSSVPVLLIDLGVNDGSYAFGFTNIPGSGFTALGTTNVALPTSDWTVLGTVPEVTPGQFIFSNSIPTNEPQEFYRVRSP